MDYFDFNVPDWNYIQMIILSPLDENDNPIANLCFLVYEDIEYFVRFTIISNDRLYVVKGEERFLSKKDAYTFVADLLEEFMGKYRCSNVLDSHKFSESGKGIELQKWLIDLGVSV